MIAEPTTSNGSQMVNHIQQLQETEKQAFRELENRTGAVTLTPEEKSAIITKINDLSATRETLYDSLHENHDFYSKNLTSAQHTLVQQTDALEVVERELNRTKRRVELINEERINRLRLVEINRYYGAKYKHHTSILKNVTLMFAVLLVIVMMNNTGKLPIMVFKSLVVIVLVIGLYAIVKELFDAYTRDNMIYAQYNWSKVSPDLEHPGNLAGSNIFNKGDDPDAGTCKNQECCGSGFTWVPPPFNKCIANSELGSEDIVSAMGEPVKPYDASATASPIII